MWRGVAFLWAAAVLGGEAWSGPRTRFLSEDGKAVLQVGERKCVSQWFTGPPSPSDIFLVSANASLSSGACIVEPCVSWGPLDDGTTKTLQTLLAAHPGAGVVLRYELHEPGELIVMMNVSDNSAHTIPLPTVSRSWGEAAGRSLAQFLQGVPTCFVVVIHAADADKKLPGRVVGTHITALQTGEWFFPGSEPLPGCLDAVPDYSNSTLRTLCEALGEDWPCQAAVPTAQERHTPTVGNTLVDGPRGTVAFACALFNEVLAEVSSSAVEVVASVAREAMEGNGVVMAFHGYHFALADRRLPSSGHLHLGALINSGALDAVVSPYLYEPWSREPTMSLVPHGPPDSPPLATTPMPWIVEDDTCTCLQPEPVTPWCTYVKTVRHTVGVLRQHVLSQAMRGGGGYFFDLFGVGWFGRPDRPNDTATLWNGVTTAMNAAMRARPDLRSGPLRPSVAVFVDEASTAAVAVDGPANGQDSFLKLLQKHPLGELAASGFPFRTHLVSDLLLPAFSAEGIRLAVFLNLVRGNSSVESAISKHLRSSGRVIVFQWAVGALSQEGGVDGSGPSRVSGLAGLRLDTSVASDLRTFTVEPPAGCPLKGLLPVGEEWGPSFPVGPLLRFTSIESSAWVLGHYSDGSPSMVMEDLGSHSVVWMGSPGPTRSVLWALGRAAAANDFIDREGGAMPLGDTVCAQGDSLLFHAGAPVEGRRLIQLPVNASEVLDEQERTVCQGCRSFPTPADVLPGDTLFFTVKQ